MIVHRGRERRVRLTLSLLVFDGESLSEDAIIYLGCEQYVHLLKYSFFNGMNDCLKNLQHPRKLYYTEFSIAEKSSSDYSHVLYTKGAHFLCFIYIFNIYILYFYFYFFDKGIHLAVENNI